MRHHGDLTTSPEKRVHSRVPTTLTGKIRIGAHQKLEDCVVVDLSAGGAGIQHSFPTPASGLICALDVAGFGTFDGITAHCGESTLGVRFLFGEADRLGLVDRLTRFVIAGVTGSAGPLAAGKARIAQVKTTSGKVMPCEVLNISLHQALLKAPAKPAVGDMVSIGRAYGRVVLHNDEGFGVEFLQLMGL